MQRNIHFDLHSSRIIALVLSYASPDTRHKMRNSRWGNDRDLARHARVFLNFQQALEILKFYRDCHCVFELYPAIKANFDRRPSDAEPLLIPGNLQQLHDFLSKDEVCHQHLLRLPTYGGPTPLFAQAFWSWDRTHVILGKNRSTLRILDRQQAHQHILPFSPKSIDTHRDLNS